MNDQLNFSNAQTKTAASAALSICESILIALNDLKIINDKDAHNVLADAAASHRSAAKQSADSGMHIAVADLIEKIMNGKNSVRKI